MILKCVHERSRTNLRRVTGLVLATRRHVTSTVIVPGTRVEVLLGRSLAMCAHPYAAWRTHSTAGRLFILLTYAAASYAVMLGVLLLSF